jgi:hydrogenase expression/formation protein HypD
VKYIDEYRDKKLVLALADKIKAISTRSINLMEVCGGHTMAIRKYGIPALLPPTIRLLSGPGCPVCVTSRRFIDHTIALARLPDVIITTFGDLIRVPGSTSSLDSEKARGADVRIVYSIIDALTLAKKNPQKRIVFPGIGFETTTPGSAAGIQMAHHKQIDNFFFLSSHKVMPPAMVALIDEGVNIDGYIGPGHVSAITGSDMYQYLAKKYRVGVVISGFEPLDLLQTIYMLVQQIENETLKVEIQYRRAVPPRGNPKAQQLVAEVFDPRDDWWRGLGMLAGSGLTLKEKYNGLNAENIPVSIEPTREPKGCICGQVLKGVKSPADCKLFGTVCTPQDPVGACMVSSEGACHAHYRYSQ